jgi:hypothetical protein
MTGGNILALKGQEKNLEMTIFYIRHIEPGARSKMPRQGEVMRTTILISTLALGVGYSGGAAIPISGAGPLSHRIHRNRHQSLHSRCPAAPQR